MTRLGLTSSQSGTPLPLRCNISRHRDSAGLVDVLEPLDRWEDLISTIDLEWYGLPK